MVSLSTGDAPFAPLEQRPLGAPFSRSRRYPGVHASGTVSALATTADGPAHAWSPMAGARIADRSVVMAASLLAMAPILILLVLQRRVVDGLAHSGMKG